MFLEQGIKKENKFGKYLLGSVFILFASFLGQMPMLLAIGYETKFKGRSYPENDEMLMRFFDPNLTLFYILISFVTNGSNFRSYILIDWAPSLSILKIFTSVVPSLLRVISNNSFLSLPVILTVCEIIV